jgi:hypothetical protein
MKRLNILLNILLPLQFAISQQDSVEAIHWDLVKEDSTFISNWVSLAITNPAKITKYFPLPRKPFYVDTLGFGYTYYEGSFGKGYVTCFYYFVLHNGKLISFVLKPQMPHRQELDSLYLKLYLPLFHFTSNGFINPFRWNNRLVQTPIFDKRFKLKPVALLDSAIQEIMAPFIGVEYGYYGGFSNEMLLNRRAFQKIKDALNDSLIIYLLHSINPATRLMVIEYLERNSYQTSIPLDKLKHDVSVILKECPRVPSFWGCTRDYGNARELLHEFLIKEK